MNPGGLIVRTLFIKMNKLDYLGGRKTFVSGFFLASDKVLAALGYVVSTGSFFLIHFIFILGQCI